MNLDLDSCKVSAAGVFGLASTTTIKFFEWSQPILEWLATAGQVAIAVATVLYLLAKWRAVRKNRK